MTEATETDRPSAASDVYKRQVKNGAIKLEKVKVIDLPRKAEWLGW